MERKDLGATSWVTSRLTVALLVGAAVLFAFRAKVLGWGALSEAVGGETALLAFGLGVCFALLAALSWEKNQLRVRCAELLEGLNQLLYGRDYASQREAIEILLRALEGRDEAARATAHQHLVRLTGQNFAADASVWRAWWSAHEKTWASRRGGAAAPDGGEPPRS